METREIRDAASLRVHLDEPTGAAVGRAVRDALRGAGFSLVPLPALDL